MTTVVGKGLDQSFRGYADIALSHITKLQVRCPNWFPLHPRIRSIAGGRRPSSSGGCRHGIARQRHGSLQWQTDLRRRRVSETIYYRRNPSEVFFAAR